MGRSENKQKTEAAIIEALFELIKENRLDVISSDTIAKEANVSKRTLYKYFPSKTHMYLAMVEAAFTELGINMNDAVLSGSNESLVEDIILLGHVYLDFMLKHPEKGSLMVDYDESGYMEAYPDMVRRIAIKANEKELSVYIAGQSKKEGIVLRDSAQNIAIFLWSHIQGLSKLLLSKKEWMENYYRMDETTIITKQMSIIRSYMKGVIIENEANRKGKS